MTLEVADLAFAWPGRERLLDGLNLRLEPGRRLAILGCNGAGKTTLGHCLAGLRQGAEPDSVRWGGKSLRGLSIAGRAALVQLVGQRPELAISGRGENVREEVAFGPENLRLPRETIAQRVDEAMTLVGIEALAARALDALSGGQTQRLALAGALAMRPSLLVLDEPMSELDAEGRALLAGWLRRPPWPMAVVFLDVRAQDWMDGLIDEVVTLREGRLEGPAPFVLPASRRATERPRKARGRPAVAFEKAGFAWPGGEAVFSGLDLEMPSGAVTAIVGPNGAGKSTMLRLIAGLEAPASGAVTVAGLDPASADPVAVARRIGVVFQESDRHFLKASLVSEVAVAARFQGADRPDDLARAALERVGLAARSSDHPLDLDAGDRRLVAVAAAIAHRPDALLLDEAQRGLDDAHLARLETVIGEEAARGACVLIVCHDADFAARNADYVVAVEKGGARLVTAADYFTAAETG